MSDHPCVSRRLRKEKGTFVIIGFVKWKEKTWAQAKNMPAIPICNLNPQAMKPAMKFGTFKHGWQVPEP